jgi:hypothetical protein
VGFAGYVTVCVQLYCVSFHCLSLHVSAYMAIFRCAGYFYFHMSEGFCFAALYRPSHESFWLCGRYDALAREMSLWAVNRKSRRECGQARASGIVQLCWNVTPTTSTPGSAQNPADMTGHCPGCPSCRPCSCARDQEVPHAVRCHHYTTSRFLRL